MDGSSEGHPWIVDDNVAPDKPLDSAVLSRLKQFSAMNKLKKMALRVRDLKIIIFKLFTLLKKKQNNAYYFVFFVSKLKK